MEEILTSVTYGMMIFIPLLPITRLFMKKVETHYYDGGDLIGYKSTIKSEWGQTYIETKPEYSTPDSWNVYEASKIAVVCFGLGLMGIVSGILKFLEPYILDLMCICSVGYIDIRDEKLGVAICEIIISILVGVLGGASFADDYCHPAKMIYPKNRKEY